MKTTRKPKATQIRFEGPDADVDRVSGDEIPQWYVYAADADSEPAGKVYTVRKSFAFAAALAGRMADERNLPLEIEAQPAYPKGPRTMQRKRYTQPEKPHELDTLKLLTTPEQFEVITDAMLGEEGDHFIAIIDRIHATWQAMPKTYESTAKGRAAVAHLHYFIGGCDWWIVEKDADPDHAGQVQAFGIADLGMGAELGYISIPELLENGAELDLYFTKPKTIGELLA